MTRRVIRALLVTVATVLVLVVVGIVTLETPWAKERVRRLAVSRATPYLTGQLAIGRLDGSLLRGVELHNVSLTQPTGEAIRAEMITVRYDPLRLWREGLAFDSIEIRSPIVHVVQEADGGWNLARLVRTRASSGGRVSFRIDAIDMEDAEVIVDTAQNEPRRLSDVHFKGDLVYEAGDLRLTVKEFTGRDDRSGFVMEKFAGSFAQGFRRINATFAGRATESRVDGRVTGDASAAGRQINVVANIDRLDLQRLFEEPRFASDITGRAEIDAAIPDAKGADSSVRFRFHGPTASAFGYAGENIDASGTLAKGHVTFAASARAYGARATIDAAWQFSPPAGGHTGFSGTGTFTGADLRRLPTHLRIPPFESQLAGRYNIRMAGGDWNAAVTLGRSSVEGATLADGTTGWMEIGRGTVRYTAQGNVAGMNVQRLSKPLDLALLAEPRFDGRLTGSFQAAGEESASRGIRRLKADAVLRDSTLGGTTFPEMNLHVELEKTRLLVHAKGGFDGLTGELADLSDRVPMDLDGTADATVVFHDVAAPLTPENVDVSGQVQLGPSTVRGVALSFASIAGAMSKGVLTLETASAEGPSIQANASGTAALGSTGESALKVALNSSDLRPVGEIVGRPISGAADLTADVTGPSSNPHATGTLNGRSISYGDTASALTLNTTFTADMPNRDITELAVHAKTESAFLKAGGFEFIKVTATSDWAHNQLVIDSELAEAERTVGLTGVLALEENARRMTLRRLDFATGDATWAMPAGREARIDFTGEQLTIDGLVLGRDAQQVSVAGSLPFEGASTDTSLEVDVVNVQLADVNRLLLGTRRLEGTVSGDVSVRGSLKAPAADATVAISQGAVEGVAFDSVRAKVQYARGLAKIDAALTQAAGAQLTVAGTVPVAAPAIDENAGMDLQVKSSPISLGLAQALTTELSAIGGTGTFDVHVTGTGKAPVVDGNVAIDGGAFTVVGTGVAYRDFVARVRFDRNRAEIGNFSIADKNGRTLRVAGGVDLATIGSARSFDVTFMTDGFAVLDNELGTVRVDAILTAQGDFASPRLSGEIRVADGRLDVGRVLEITTNDLYSTTPLEPGDDGAAPPIEGAGDQVAKAAATAAAAPTETRSSLLSRVDLNLNVRLPDNFVMRGRDLRTGRSSMGLGDMNIVAGGDLRIRKPANGPPTLVGNLQILRGYYAFQGRRFDVRPESVVRFRGQNPIDPALNVTADRQISGVTASVDVRGSLREPEVNLSSRPPLDEADLLALIVFGQPVNDLGASQRVSLSERAATMAAGAIATPITDSVARALNLDLFEIQSPAGEAATVSLGTQIGSRLYVGVRQQVGRADSSALSIEYRIASFLRLVTSVVHGAMDTHASERYEQSGADMIFTWRH
jgi:hypothetical protein